MIEHLIGGGGPGTALMFVAVYVALTVALVPGSVSSLAAGALFGAVWGSLLTLLGATLGATAAFHLARRFGRAPVRARTGRRLQRLDGWVERRGFATVLYVRLVPVFPFNVANYAFGLTAVDSRRYIAATALGITPATVAFVALGSSLDQPGSPGFLIALAMVLVLVLGAPLIERTFKKNGAPAPESSAGRDADSRARINAASATRSTRESFHSAGGSTLQVGTPDDTHRPSRDLSP